MSIKYRQAYTKDAALLIDIYNASFYDDYIRYGECPAYGRTRTEMEMSIANYPKIIISWGERNVGAISYKNTAAGEYYIGCLCVIPECQGIGIGTDAFHHLLSVCSDWKKIALVTPVDKKENIRFYTEKCGMSIGGTQTDGNVKLVQLYMKR